MPLRLKLFNPEVYRFNTILNDIWGLAGAGTMT
jgi:hypothetical protein